MRRLGIGQQIAMGSAIMTGSPTPPSRGFELPSCPHCEAVRSVEIELALLRQVVAEHLMDPFKVSRDGLIAALDKRNQHYEARCIICGGPSAEDYEDILGDGPVCHQHGMPTKTQIAGQDAP